jgi:hypothetical protein
MDNNVAIKVHEFFMSDCDDLDIYVAEPLNSWLSTECGSWVRENSVGMRWHSFIDPDRFGHKITVVATMTEQNAVFYQLKWR